MSDIKNPRIYIREKIHDEIKKVVENYFYITYNKAQYPYAIVDIKEIGNEVLTQYVLDVSVYDKKEDTTVLEKVCDDLKILLDRKKEIDKNYAFAIWFNACLTDKEEEKTIKKRILSFEIHLFNYK